MYISQAILKNIIMYYITIDFTIETVKK